MLGGERSSAGVTALISGTGCLLQGAPLPRLTDALSNWMFERHTERLKGQHPADADRYGPL